MQEARIPIAEAEAAASAAKARGMQMHMGPAAGGEHLLAAAHVPGRCSVRSEAMLGISGRHLGRHQHLAVYFGQRCAIHIVNCYGYAGGPPDLERNADLLLEGLAWLSGLGGAPALLVGDLNCSLRDAGMEGLLGVAGWKDLLAALGPTCIPSHGAPSRLDYVLANAGAQAMVARVGLRWDLGLATHGALLVEFQVAPPERALLRQPVVALDGGAAEGWNAESAHATTAAVQAHRQEAFHSALDHHDLPSAWQQLHAAMREWLAVRRGLQAVPDRPHAAAAWQADRPPTAGGLQDATPRGV